MASRITQQQHDEIVASNGQPVPVEDVDGDKIYFLVDGDYLHTSREQLKALVQEGIRAAHIPAAEAEDELRRHADRLAAKRA